MITSPCIGVCAYDETTGWCLGCGRSETEIGGWSVAPAEDRARVWAELPGRLRALGVGVRRPDWTLGAMRDELLARLRAGRGCWVLGAHGAVAELPIADPAAELQGPEDAPEIVARGHGGALRLRLTARTRAIEALDAAGGVRALILAIHRSRLEDPPAPGLRPLGPDPDAIDGAEGELFDLGLGFAEARFLVRTEDPALARALRALAGAPLARVLAEAGAALVEVSPTRVVETPFARGEITAPIPAPGGRSPAGCHTHLLPGALALGRTLAPGLELPEAYAPAGVLYPPAP